MEYSRKLDMIRSSLFYQFRIDVSHSILYMREDIKLCLMSIQHDSSHQRKDNWVLYFVTDEENMNIDVSSNQSILQPIKSDNSII
jgi:hypothetical protein